MEREENTTRKALLSVKENLRDTLRLWGSAFVWTETERERGERRERQRQRQTETETEYRS
jgi:hypothetical protein